MSYVIILILLVAVLPSIISLFNQNIVWKTMRFINFVRLFVLILYSFYDTLLFLSESMGLGRSIVYYVIFGLFSFVCVFFVNLFLWGIFSWVFIIMPFRLGYIKTLKVKGLKYKLCGCIPVLSDILVRRLRNNVRYNIN